MKLHILLERVICKYFFQAKLFSEMNSWMDTRISRVERKLQKVIGNQNQTEIKFLRMRTSNIFEKQ